jgi:hypothetical protein
MQRWKTRPAEFPWNRLGEPKMQRVARSQGPYLGGLEEAEKSLAAVRPMKASEG